MIKEHTRIEFRCGDYKNGENLGKLYELLKGICMSNGWKTSASSAIKKSFLMLDTFGSYYNVSIYISFNWDKKLLNIVLNRPRDSEEIYLAPFNNYTLFHKVIISRIDSYLKDQQSDCRHGIQINEPTEKRILRVMFPSYHKGIVKYTRLIQEPYRKKNGNTNGLTYLNTIYNNNANINLIKFINYTSEIDHSDSLLMEDDIFKEIFGCLPDRLIEESIEKYKIDKINDEFKSIFQLFARSAPKVLILNDHVISTKDYLEISDISEVALTRILMNIDDDKSFKFYSDMDNKNDLTYKIIITDADVVDGLLTLFSIFTVHTKTKKISKERIIIQNNTLKIIE